MMGEITHTAPHKPHRVLVVDDHPLFRKGASQLLEMDSNFELVGEATNGSDGITLVNKLKPDIVLLDLNMKDMNGIDVLKQLKALEIDTVVIMLTVSDQSEDLIAALRYGADGYLLKDMEPEEILKNLHKAASGQVVLDETVSAILINAIRDDGELRSVNTVHLTDRESEILSLISAGMSNKLIARALDISEGTVKVHVKNILRKLKLHSRLEAAIWAREHNFSHQL